MKIKIFAAIARPYILKGMMMGRMAKIGLCVRYVKNGPTRTVNKSITIKIYIPFAKIAHMNIYARFAKKNKNNQSPNKSRKK